MKVTMTDIAGHNSVFREEFKVQFDIILESGRFLGGEVQSEFEREFSRYHGNEIYCVACGNGTQAIELILRGLNIGPGDEVIVPTLTCIASVEPIKIVGAEVVFCDVVPQTACLDPADVAKKISSKTKAVIGVNLYGNTMDYDLLMAITEKHKIHLIEDCAQSHGATHKGEKAGIFGVAAAYSFYPTKNLGALGDAGAVISKDQNLIAKVRSIANHGEEGKDNHKRLGINSRLDSLQCAFLTQKLKYLNEFNNRRKHNAELYKKLLYDDIPVISGGEGAVYHQFVILAQMRERLVNHLRENEVETQVHYPYLNHILPAFRNDKNYPSAQQLSEHILSLPIHPDLKNEQIEYVAELINRFYSAS